jgi:hypothetical protein
MPSRTDDPPRPPPEVDAVPLAPSETAHGRELVTTPASEAQQLDDPVLTEETFRAILSSHERAGRWEAADEIHVRAIFGEVTLDFTRADLPPSGEIEIDAWAIGGEVHIIVPDGAEVELDGTPIVGSIEQQLRKKRARDRVRELVTGQREEDLPPPPAAPQPPFFRIDAHAIAGAVKVTGR